MNKKARRATIYATRTFRGKRFRIEDSYDSKKAARSVRNKLQKAGWLVRVVPTRSGWTGKETWSVYKRRKR